MRTNRLELGRGTKPLTRRKPGLIKEEDRFRLRYGPYQPPLVKKELLDDAVRGTVKFGGFTHAPIPWPKVKKTGRASLILCGDLVRAVKRESRPAVAHHWGVSRSTVTNWRRILAVPELTEGSERLVRIGVKLARLPQSRNKIAAAARGRHLSPEVKAKLFAGIRRGWKSRSKARRAAYCRTGRFPPATKSDPWIPGEEALLGTLPVPELLRLLGRSESAIWKRKSDLGIRSRPPSPVQPWTGAEVKLLGTAPDRVLAKRLGRSVDSVMNKRRKLGIRITCPSWRPWTRQEEARIGKRPDWEIARQLGRSIRAVQHRRLALGLPHSRTPKK